MLRIYFITIFLFSSLLAQAQKKSKLKVIENAGHFGVKSGKKTIISPVFKAIRLEENGLISVKDSLGRWGYFDSKGNLHIPPRFIETLPFENNQALVKKEDGWGIIDEEGRFLIKPLYKEIERQDINTFKVLPFYNVIVYKVPKDTVATFLTDSVTKLSNDLYAYFLDGKSGLIDTAGNKICLPLYDSIGKFSNTNAVIIRDKKWGVISNYGKEIIPTDYDSIVIDSTNYIRGVVKQNPHEQWFLFDSQGKALTASAYSFIDQTSTNSVFLFQKEEGYGLMDTSATEIQSPAYSSFVKVEKGYLLKNNLGQGYLSGNGKWNFPPRADSIIVLPKGFVIYSLNKVNYLLDPKGKEVFCTKEKLFPLKEELVGVISNGKYGRLNFKGEVILEPIYDSISPLSKDSSLIVYKDRQVGLYNFLRDSLVGPSDRIQEIFPVSEGFYGVKIKGKYGFVDGLGRIRIANRYQGIGRFYEGMAPVKLLGKWGFIDKAERLRVQPSFDEVGEFSQGIAIVKKDGKTGLINTNGSILTPFVYNDIERAEGGYFISKKKTNNGYLKGMLSQEGKEMIYAKYDDIKINSDGNLIVKRNNKYAVVNQRDLILLSFIYKKIEYDEFTRNYITIQERDPEVITIKENK